MSSPKHEFTEILTSSDLLPTSSQEETFPAVITKNSLLSSPPPLSESSFSTTSIILSESPADLVHIYDNTFPDLQQYHDFITRKLTPWKQSLEFKHFNTLYLNHRQLKKNITAIRTQAQQLLDQANSLQTHHDLQMIELQRFIPAITNREFDHMLHRPSKEYPKPPRFTEIIRAPLSSQTRLKISNSMLASQGSRSQPSETLRNSPSRTTDKTTYTCFQCGSTLHIKWFCPDYRCPFCRHISPGHSQGNCPLRPIKHADEQNYHLGHYDIDGEDDGNLTGEH